MILELAFAASLLVPVAETKQPPTAPPTAIVIVACRVDDLTGQPGRHDAAMAAKGWRDLELHVVDGELQCKREVLSLEDASFYSPKALMDMLPLHPDFSDWVQCAKVGVVQMAEYDRTHPGWGTVAVGCPTPIVDGNDKVIAFKLPECPSHVPGTDSPMKCRFDGSAV